MHRLCYFYKLVTTHTPLYLFNYLPSRVASQRYPNCFNSLPCRTVLFQNSFFPYSIAQWNQLDLKIKNCTSYPVFRNSLLKIIKPLENSIYNIHDPQGIKLLSRLRLGFSHLREHKFRHNFQDTLNPLCSCSLEPENNTHFLLRCHNYDDLRIILMSELYDIDPSIYSLSDENLTYLLLYGDKKYSFESNRVILLATIKVLKSSLRFEETLF